MKPIFHIAKQSDWQQAQNNGAYSHSTLHKTLDDEGFIHCSNSDQVMYIANLMYKNENDLLLLCIDTQKLGSPVKYENTSGGTELYPHIYGTLNVDAVYAIVPLTKNDKGDFIAPDELHDNKRFY